MAGANARRWLVLNVSSRRAGDNEYFRVLNAELDNGGIAPFLDFLLRVDLSDFNPAADLPRTEALKQQQEFAAPLHAIWALDLVEQDMDGQWLPVGMGTSVFGTAVATAELYENYKLFAQANRKSPITYAAFSKWLASLGLNSAKIRNAKRGWLLPKTPQEFAKIVRKTAGIHS